MFDHYTYDRISQQLRHVGESVKLLRLHNGQIEMRPYAHLVASKCQKIIDSLKRWMQAINQWLEQQ